MILGVEVVQQLISLTRRPLVLEQRVHVVAENAILTALASTQHLDSQRRREICADMLSTEMNQPIQYMHDSKTRRSL